MKKLQTSVTVLLITCILPLSSSLIHAQKKKTRVPDNYAARLNLFEQFVKEQMTKDKTPGLTIGFMKDDQTWVKGFGYADVENKIPATSESAYRLASVTKTMTGTAIVQLVERGKMKLDEEIQTYVPYYPKQKWPVTVKQLLVHLGGGQTGSGIGPEHVTPREVVARIAKYPIKNEPGFKFDYQTSGYNLLGAAIEEVSGKSFDEYLRENIWAPLGMNDTRMDDPKLTIPNRVQRYELVNGEIKIAPFIDVSSRFGGGGAIGTVPDMLRWAHNIERSGILSRSSFELMMTPVANKGGRYVGLDDGAWYYTLGWLVFPVNGQYVYYNDGGQTGTNTMVFHIPSQNLTIAFASNVMTIDRMPYVKALYQAVTGKTWEIPVYTKDKYDEAVYRGMSSTFNYGSLHFDRTKRSMSADSSETAKAFAFFNNTVNRDSLHADFDKTVAAINDGRHPAGNAALIKVGSQMAQALHKKYGRERIETYHSTGTIPFFADYIAMYKSNPRYPAELRFNSSFEKMVEKWNADWAKSWNDYTRRFDSAAASDLNNIEQNLRPLFAGAEVYPNLINQLLDIRQSFAVKKDWDSAAKAAKIAAELYPHSDRANVYFAISLVVIGKKDEAHLALKKAVEINRNGIASPGTLNQIAVALSGIDKLPAAIARLEIATAIYPADAALFSTLGDFYQKTGQPAAARDAYQKALTI
ncbi:MAG TPA: serine hydrolase, partial [Pyrinomonadaceae bacterium]|nr:serine hydrolase [Pyrinomonadaceae bacterium]